MSRCPAEPGSGVARSWPCCAAHAPDTGQGYQGWFSGSFGETHAAVARGLISDHRGDST